jgi:hypothetical protein
LLHYPFRDEWRWTYWWISAKPGETPPSLTIKRKQSSPATDKEPLIRPEVLPVVRGKALRDMRKEKAFGREKRKLIRSSIQLPFFGSTF